MTRAPLAPEGFPALPPVAGARFASGAAGVRYKRRTDLTLIALVPGTAVAGVFTRSATRSAAVLDCEAKLAANEAAEAGACIVVNSGNSNAFTGRQGAASVAGICAAAAEALGVPEARVFTASTGVIGEPLPHERIVSALPALAAELDAEGIEAAARAIMTTDTFPKGASARVETPEDAVTIAGIAKGSGMIAPDMATMLAYVVTDAAIPQAALQAMLARQADLSFNRITVDGDTSTSDTLMLAATAQGPAPDHAAFEAALGAVLLDLAHQVVRDGEGATKFVSVEVTGAANEADALLAARAIANSPLVKTAVAGEDPNWGRIVMAVGKSGARADRDRLAIRLGDVEVAREGFRAPGYSEERAAGHMKGQEIVIAVDLGLGEGRATVWTCDLTHRYIDINADYRS